MTQSGHTSTIFSDGLDAWFSEFNLESITEKLTYLLSLSKEDIAAIGQKGQTRLLEVKNYENIAKTIADQLGAL